MPTMHVGSLFNEMINKKGLGATTVEGFCEKHGAYQTFAFRNHEAKCPHCVMEAQQQVDMENNLKILSNRGVMSFWKDGKRQENAPMRFEHVSFDNYLAQHNDQAAIKQSLMSYADSFVARSMDNRNIVLSGRVGTGKTHLAIAMGRRIAERGMRAAYLTIFDLLQNQNSLGSGNEIISQLESYDLLILDELGAHPDIGFSSERVGSIMFQLIDSRYRECSATTLITNISEDDLKTSRAGLGIRAMDRLKDARFYKFRWSSER